MLRSMPARARNRASRSLPLTQAVGIARTMSASGYRLWPTPHIATALAILAASPREPEPWTKSRVFNLGKCGTMHFGVSSPASV
jgi:hypothetical protein